MITPRPIFSLLDYTFHIPAYQRGYRWDVEQVNALLNDLKIFARKSKEVESTQKLYYCLQPVAVVEDSGQPDTYHVVDGQQRLTTLYLLMQYLKQGSEYRNSRIFSLKMDARNRQQAFLDKRLYADPKDTTYTGNIDTFYLRKSYEAIQAWFEKENPRLYQSFRAMLLERPEEGDSQEMIDRMHNVRVIWYVIEGVKARDAFRRLNYGKIPLTSAELVKALLVQNHIGGSETIRQGASYRRAIEWDMMEKTLQNPYLWSMLCESPDDATSRLELLLDFVADDLNETITERNSGEAIFVRKDKEYLDFNPDIRDYFNYNVIEYALGHNIRPGEQTDSRTGDDALEFIWGSIRKVFNLITNWYDNREWYHLIGLLRIMPKKKQRKTQRAFLKEIYNLSIDKESKKPVEKPEFRQRLMKRIKSAIPTMPKEKTLARLRYGEDDDVMRGILTMLNVKTAIDDPTEGSRFAFYLYDKYNPISLDHIHPQNIAIDNLSYDEYQKWFERSSANIKLLHASDYERTGNEAADASEEEAGSEQNKQQSKYTKADVENACEVIKEITASKESFTDPDNRSRLDKATKVIDSFFGQLTGISKDDLDSIKNMALVDVATNAALQNYFLDRKRDILMQRHAKGVSDRAAIQSDNEGTYAMPATRKVYNKDYSRNSPGDMRFWRTEDREKYFMAIEAAYNYFQNVK